MGQKKHGNPVATYVITALILAVITYIEFAIVEYDFPWLTSGAVLFWLIALSIVKFIMVIAIFMHLKDDELTYSGFFSSGLILALATFIILPILFTGLSFKQQGAQAEEQAQTTPPLTESQQADIASDGESRGAGERLASPPPSDRSLAVEPPAAADPEVTLRQPQADVTAQADEAAEDESPAAQDAAAAAAEDEAEGEQAAQADDAEAPAAAAGGDFDRELGESVYASFCVSCHQGQGQGLPGVFPPLAGHVPDIYNVDGGREYLIEVVLYGLSGQITVDGQTYNGAMPAWGGQLNDDQVAAVVDHISTAWGNEEELDGFTPTAASEVAGLRDQGLSTADMNEVRSALGLE